MIFSELQLKKMLDKGYENFTIEDKIMDGMKISNAMGSHDVDDNTGNSIIKISE